MGKRFLSLLLAVMLVVGMVPASALAAAETRTATGNEAAAVASVTADEQSAGSIAADVYMFNGTVTLDGQLTEQGWILSTVFRTAVDGTVSKVYTLWQEDCLLLALDCGDAARLTVTLGETAKTIDLTETISTADGITGAVKNGVAELRLPLLAFDVLRSNYNDGPFYFDFALDGTQMLPGGMALNFTGNAARTLDFNVYDYKTGNVTVSSAQQIKFPTASASGERSYWGDCDMTDGISVNVDMYWEQTLNIASMTTSDGAFTSNTATDNGYLFWITDGIDSTTTGNCTIANLYNSSTDGLVLRVRQDGDYSVNYQDVKLNRRAGDGAFTLGYLWNADHSVSVYVDDVPMGTVNDAMCASVLWVGRDAIMLNNYGKSNITVSDLTLHIMRYTDMSGEITPEKIFGSLDLTAVTRKLPLVTTFATEHMGDVALRWESSDPDVVAPDGTVTPNDTTDVPVTLSLFVGHSTTALWTQDVIVKHGKETVDAVLSQENVTVDGILSEIAYINWQEFATVNAAYAPVWARGKVYFAVNGDSEGTLTLTVNGKAVDISLADGAVAIDGVAVTGAGVRNETTGLVEVGIPLADLGITLTDYNQHTIVSAKFTKGTDSETLPEAALVFTGKVAVCEDLSGYNANGSFSVSGTTVTYNGTQPGAVHYLYENGNAIDHTQRLILSQDLEFNNLPGSGKINGGATAEGFYAWFNDGVVVGKTTEGTAIFYTIFADANGKLSLRLGNGNAGEGTVYALDRSLNQKFRLTFIWNTDDTLEIYVDGEPVAVVANASFFQSAAGADVITYRYYAAKSSSKVKFTVGNVSMLSVAYKTVLDELTRDMIFGDIDLTHVRKDLPMVTNYTNANLGTLTLHWETTNPDAVAADGTVTRHDTDYGRATVSVYIVEPDGTKTWLWDADITVDPKSVGDKTAPEVIHTAFAPAGSVTLDGSYTDEGWLLNGWALDSGDTICGEFGAQWDQTSLYLAIDYGTASAVKFTLGDAGGKNTEFVLDIAGKKLTAGGADVPGSAVAISGTVAEIKLPMGAFTAEKIDRYDVLLDIALELTVGSDTARYTGALKLTSVDWWLTDDKAEGMSVQNGNVASVKLNGGEPDGNQGATRFAGGWRMYDLYASGAPTGVRTYILFLGDTVYDNFNDRTEATHVEFDFMAKAMPEWNYSKNVGLFHAFSSYGMTFSLSDKQDSSKNSNVVVGGIMNTPEGLVFTVGADDPFMIPLKRKNGAPFRVGDQFRVGITWELDGEVKLYINGELYQTINGMSRRLNAVGNNSFVLNLLRNTDERTEGDDLDIYITNLAFGKAYSTTNILKSLTFDDFRGTNEYANAIVSNLVLPENATNGQLDAAFKITWESSDETVIDPATGTVTRPDSGIVHVKLTATLTNGERKTFDLTVLGLSTDSGSTLVVTNDTNPFTGKGVICKDYQFTLDTTNNSVIYNMGEQRTVNHVYIADLDESSRINRESLRLFVSNDNVTYTEIEDYKLLDYFGVWYLYDFTATAQYFKVHYTHFDGTHADFINAPANMIGAGYDEILLSQGKNDDFTTVKHTLTNHTGKTQRDYAFTIDTTPYGITGMRTIRVMLNGSFLYHYCDGTDLIVRVPDLAAGESVDLTIYYSNTPNHGALDISNKENVYEVTYGTRETTLSGGRWVMTLPAGTRFPDGSVLEKETIYAMHGTQLEISTDGGYTWTKLANVQNNAPAGKTPAPPISCGGWGFDSRTGRLLYEAYTPEGTLVFNRNDKTKSSCETHIIASDDGGKTWYLMDTLGKVSGDAYSYYVLSYSEIVELRGNDGSGPNVDFVVNMGAQYNNNGAFCGRVAYTTDGGFNWQYSQSLITFGNETAFEGGISECTILEREDGTLVLYARCQSSGVDNFAMAYSLDHGVTWTTPGLKSGIYTVNTQPLMYKYDLDGNGTKEASVFLWGGNNVQGGNSYIRNPLCYAVSTNGMDTFRNIQNVFAETFMEIYTQEASHYITNASGHMVNGDDMYVAFGRLYHGDSIYMHISNFDDWFTRTKGAYDSFEHGNARYEGWVPYAGSVAATEEMSYDGLRSMRVAESTNVTRSIPYLQNGEISFAIWVDGATSFTVELQPAYSSTAGKIDIITATVTGSILSLANGETLKLLSNNWNVITFDLELTEGKASVAANGVTKEVPVDMTLGDYICYITINAGRALYLDELMVTSRLDAVTVATEEDEAAAQDLIEQIKSIGDVTAADAKAIRTAMATYKAMSLTQRDLVNRRIRLSEADSNVAQSRGDAISNYMINYYEVLVAAEAALDALEAILPGFGVNLVLNETIDMNLIPAGGVALDGNVISLTYADGSVAEYSIAAVNGSPAVRHSFNADQMSQTITIQIFDAQGTPLTKELTISVRDYVAKLLSVTRNDTEKALMIRLLDYGALAQIYGARAAGETVQAADLANSIITSDLRAFMNSYNMGTPESYNPNMVSTGGTFSANLTLNESVDLNIYVDPGKMNENEKIVVKLGDQVLTEGQYKQSVTADGKIAIRYSFNADRMNEELTVALADETSGDVRISLTMSVRKLAYVTMANYSSDTVLCATFAALLDYGALAQQYAGTNTDDLANRYVTADQRRMLTEYPWPAN